MNEPNSIFSLPRATSSLKSCTNAVVCLVLILGLSACSKSDTAAKAPVSTDVIYSYDYYYKHYDEAKALDATCDMIGDSQKMTTQEQLEEYRKSARANNCYNAGRAKYDYEMQQTIAKYSKPLTSKK